jgi:hypothetical protein
MWKEAVLPLNRKERLRSQSPRCGSWHMEQERVPVWFILYLQISAQISPSREANHEHSLPQSCSIVLIPPGCICVCLPSSRRTGTLAVLLLARWSRNWLVVSTIRLTEWMNGWLLHFPQTDCVSLWQLHEFVHCLLRCFAVVLSEAF